MKLTSLQETHLCNLYLSLSADIDRLDKAMNKYEDSMDPRYRRLESRQMMIIGQRAALKQLMENEGVIP